MPAPPPKHHRVSPPPREAKRQHEEKVAHDEVGPLPGRRQQLIAKTEQVAETNALRSYAAASYAAI